MDIIEAVTLSSVMYKQIDSNIYPEYKLIAEAGKVLAWNLEYVKDYESAAVAMAGMAGILMDVSAHLDSFTSNLLVHYASSYFYAAHILFNK